MNTNRSQTSRAIGSSLIIAGLFLQASIALKWLTPDPLSAEMAHRLMGVLMGALVVFYANDVPKSLTPLVRMRCDPAAEQALRRFAGWSLALGGAAFAAASLLAPFENANAIAVSALGSSVLLVIARLTGMLAGGGKGARVIFSSRPSTTRRGEEGHGHRRQLPRQLDEGAGSGRYQP